MLQAGLALGACGYSRWPPRVMCNLYNITTNQAARPSGFIEPCLPSKATRPPCGPLWVHEITTALRRCGAPADALRLGEQGQNCRRRPTRCVSGAMDMNGHDISLVVAGLIGSGVAIVHGVLTQRLLVKPTLELSIPSRARKLIPGLLHSARLTGSSAASPSSP